MAFWHLVRFLVVVAYFIGPRVCVSFKAGRRRPCVSDCLSMSVVFTKRSPSIGPVV
jgi:hypothetical protein